jgi:hypothetical protein
VPHRSHDQADGQQRNHAQDCYRQFHSSAERPGEPAAR